MREIDQIVPETFCISCKGCCRFAHEGSVWTVHLSSGEQQSLGIPDSALPVSPPDAGGTCACGFFDTRQNLCTIYYKRPLECRLYPFLINRQDRTVFLSLDMHCPYAKAHYETQKMRDYIAYLSAVCSSPEFIRLLRDNPWLIQQYPDVLNVAAIPV